MFQTSASASSFGSSATSNAYEATLYRKIQEGDTSGVKNLINSKPSIAVKDTSYGTPLHIALDVDSSKFSLETVDFLIKSGADVSKVNVALRTSRYGDPDRSTPLQIAARRGNVPAVLLLLQRNCDKNSIAPDGRDAIDYALHSQHPLETLTALLEGGTKITWRNRKHTALTSPHLTYECMKLILDHEKDKDFVNYMYTNTEPNKRTKILTTSPIHVAASSGDLRKVRLLTDLGVKVDVKNFDGLTALHVGVAANSIPVVNLLVEKGFGLYVKDKMGLAPLHHCRSVDMAKALLAFGCKLETIARQETLFYKAVHWRRFDLANYLLNLGISIDVNACPTAKNTALQEAVAAGDANLTRILLAHGANPNKNNRQFTCVQLAAQAGKEEVLQLLFDVGARTSDSYQKRSQARTLEGNALSLAVERNNPKMVSLLLGEGEPFDSYNVKGLTLLHHAIEMLNRAVLGVLLSSRQFGSVTAANGWTGLHLYAFLPHQPNETIAQMLVNAGCPIHAKTPKGFDALRIAVLAGTHGNVHTLLQAGADPNRPDEEGWTALHTAALAPRVEVINALIAGGADNTLRTNAGFTAIEIAAFTQHRLSNNPLVGLIPKSESKEKFALPRLQFQLLCEERECCDAQFLEIQAQQQKTYLEYRNRHNQLLMQMSLGGGTAATMAGDSDNDDAVSEVAAFLGATAPREREQRSDEEDEGPEGSPDTKRNRVDRGNE